MWFIVNLLATGYSVWVAQLLAQGIDLFPGHFSLGALASFAPHDAFVDSDGCGVFSQRLVAAGALEICRGDPLAEPFSAVVANFVVGLDGLAVLAHVLIRLGNVKPSFGSVVAFEQLLGKELFEFFDGLGVLAFLFEDDASFELSLNDFGMIGILSQKLVRVVRLLLQQIWLVEVQTLNYQMK